MNIPFTSDRDVRVYATLEFDGHPHFPENPKFQFVVDIPGEEVVTVCTVGRTPQEVVSMELMYDEFRFPYLFKIDSAGEHFETIKIYEGRDYWSQLLRNKAMEYGGT
jgi:hypothetical protein